MENAIRSISADSITGMIFAAEGINGALTLLNGPMGCKFYHSTTSQFLTVRPKLYIPSPEGTRVPVDYNYLNSWFFRQPQVPCTYLDEYDYVYGTSEKVKEALLFMDSHLEFELLAIINSPGAALIGDNLKELAQSVLPQKRILVLESPGFSLDFSAGYEIAATELVKQLLLPQTGTTVSAHSALTGASSTLVSTQSAASDVSNSPVSSQDVLLGDSITPISKPGVLSDDSDTETADSLLPKVNVLGLSIWDRYYEGDKEELTRLLKLVGAEVNCFLCGGCNAGEIEKLSEASLNLVVNSERGLKTARLLEENYGIPYVSPEGLPIGFDATEKMMYEVCEVLGIPKKAFEEYAQKSRALAYYRINDIYKMCGLPKGAAFAISGSTAQVYSFSLFFTEYLGMTPDSLFIEGEKDPFIYEKLVSYLDKTGEKECLNTDTLDTKAELVFSDANTIAMLNTTNHVFCGIEISFPGMGYTDVLPKTQMGIQGSLFLIEQVLNGLMSKL